MHGHCHHHHFEWWLAPAYAVWFMLLVLAGVLWLYGIVLWYMGCAAVAAWRSAVIGWRAFQAGTLRTHATAAAVTLAVARSFPQPPFPRPRRLSLR